MLGINKIHQGDCIEEMRKLEDNSVDSIVTDPPYGLEFMGKRWDKFGAEIKEFSKKEKGGFGGYKNHIRFGKSTTNGFQEFCYEWAKEALRVLKPGGYLLSFGGSRTYHRMACAIEDAGFEIRDQIMWVYGSGFPKSHNIGKAVDKLQGNEREIVGEKILGGIKRARPDNAEGFSNPYTSGQSIGIETKGNSKWEGWGTALKPAHEPIVVARKPLSEKTIALNVLKWGTGGINIDESRVETEDRIQCQTGHKGQPFESREHKFTPREYTTQGRFPANLIHDGSDEVVGLFPETGKSNVRKISAKENVNINNQVYGKGYIRQEGGFVDSGSASRFFYCAKASKSERNAGLEGFENTISINGDKWTDMDRRENNKPTIRKNHHPTVKPVKLMQYLTRLITPKGGMVLDPFIGSGTTGIACKKEGFNFIGIEKDKEYVDIANKRLEQKTFLELNTL